MADTPSAYLARDHDRLDGLLAQARLKVEVNEPAATTFAEFRAGLERHMRLEEELLFPAFERHMKMTGGPTAVMRHEHEVVRRYLDDMGAALGRLDIAGFRTASERLEGVLASHNLKEERILYPMVDRLLPDGERRELAEQLSAG
jgi:iron-sulfur cluster repair protein YtfE (RIC family)